MLQSTRLRLACGIGLLAAAQVAGLFAAPPVRRARPPVFDKSASDAFFPDARKALSGERPAAQAAPRTGSESPSGEPATPNNIATKFAWSKLIDAETIEDEIKSCQSALSEAVTVPARFKSDGHKVGRKQFSVAAVMFGIVAQYDGPIRWQPQAPAVRDALAKAGFNCKAGTDATYTESKTRKEDLESLVRGGNVALRPRGDEEPTWDKVASRSVLMTRMEQAQQQAIAPYTANSAEFGHNSEKLRHEAQILAALSEVIRREKFEDADDSSYQQAARALQAGALQIGEAIKLKSYEQARKAAGNVSKACNTCHESFRSQ